MIIRLPGSPHPSPSTPSHAWEGLSRCLFVARAVDRAISASDRTQEVQEAPASCEPGAAVEPSSRFSKRQRCAAQRSHPRRDSRSSRRDLDRDVRDRERSSSRLRRRACAFPPRHVPSGEGVSGMRAMLGSRSPGVPPSFSRHEKALHALLGVLSTRRYRPCGSPLPCSAALGPRGRASSRAST